MKIQTRDNTELRIKEWGTGRPVILIHGWPLSADSWDDQAMPLADAGFRVIAYDRRGFGYSDQPFGGYDYDTLADDLADVITATGADRATIVGFSMGGGEVARYMSRHGGRHVSQAVLVASVVPFLLQTPDHPEGLPREVFDSMAEEIEKDRAAFFGSFFKDFYGSSFLSRPVSAELLEWSRNVAMLASLKATLACARSFAMTDFRPDLPHFRVPTLVIHGTGDKTVPIAISGRAAAAGIANSKLLEYEGAPHGLFATHKRRLTEDLLQFLATVR